MVLIWSQVIKGLMRRGIIVDMFPVGQLLIMFLEVLIDITALIILLSIGSIRPLHVPVELRRLRRKDGTEGSY
jgi:hypothetical protein